MRGRIGLAHYLRRLGVKPDERVGICVERSVEMVVGLLGVLKAGGAYVPLDPSYPAERLAYMLEDSRPVVVLTQGRECEARRGAGNGARSGGCATVLDLELDAAAGQEEESRDPERASRWAECGHLAYVIYTSGSTGTPKGVMSEHGKW